MWHCWLIVVSTTTSWDVSVHGKYRMSRGRGSELNVFHGCIDPCITCFSISPYVWVHCLGDSSEMVVGVFVQLGFILLIDQNGQWVVTDQISYLISGIWLWLTRLLNDRSICSRTFYAIPGKSYGIHTDYLIFLARSLQIMPTIPPLMMTLSERFHCNAINTLDPFSNLVYVRIRHR